MLVADAKHKVHTVPKATEIKSSVRLSVQQALYEDTTGNMGEELPQFSTAASCSRQTQHMQKNGERVVMAHNPRRSVHRGSLQVATSLRLLEFKNLIIHVQKHICFTQYHTPVWRVFPQGLLLFSPQRGTLITHLPGQDSIQNRLILTGYSVPSQA